MLRKPHRTGPVVTFRPCDEGVICWVDKKDTPFILKDITHFSHIDPSRALAISVLYYNKDIIVRYIIDFGHDVVNSIPVDMLKGVNKFSLTAPPSPIEGSIGCRKFYESKISTYDRNLWNLICHCILRLPKVGNENRHLRQQQGPPSGTEEVTFLTQQRSLGLTSLQHVSKRYRNFNSILTLSEPSAKIENL